MKCLLYVWIDFVWFVVGLLFGVCVFFEFAVVCVGCLCLLFGWLVDWFCYLDLLPFVVVGLALVRCFPKCVCFKINLCFDLGCVWFWFTLFVVTLLFLMWVVGCLWLGFGFCHLGWLCFGFVAWGVCVGVCVLGVLVWLVWYFLLLWLLGWVCCIIVCGVCCGCLCGLGVWPVSFGYCWLNWWCFIVWLLLDFWFRCLFVFDCLL